MDVASDFVGDPISQKTRWCSGSYTLLAPFSQWFLSLKCRSETVDLLVLDSAALHFDQCWFCVMISICVSLMRVKTTTLHCGKHEKPSFAMLVGIFERFPLSLIWWHHEPHKPPTNMEHCNLEEIALQKWVSLNKTCIKAESPNHQHTKGRKVDGCLSPLICVYRQSYLKWGLTMNTIQSLTKT